jgi:Na+/H+-dicarboxylate symporter
MHDAFPMQNSLKQGDVLSLLLLYFALGFAIRTIKENHEGTNLKATQ